MSRFRPGLSLLSSLGVSATTGAIALATPVASIGAIALNEPIANHLGVSQFALGVATIGTSLLMAAIAPACLDISMNRLDSARQSLKALQTGHPPQAMPRTSP